jgi:hypothetical protein
MAHFLCTPSRDTFPKTIAANSPRDRHAWTSSENRLSLPWPAQNPGLDRPPKSLTD